MELCTATRVLVLFTFLQFSSVWIGYNCWFTEVSLFSTTTMCLHLTPANLVLGAERNYCIKYTKRCWLTDKIFMNKVWYWPLPIVISAVISILKQFLLIQRNFLIWVLLKVMWIRNTSDKTYAKWGTFGINNKIHVFVKNKREETDIKISAILWEILNVIQYDDNVNLHSHLIIGMFLTISNI